MWALGFKRRARKRSFLLEDRVLSLRDGLQIWEPRLSEACEPAFFTMSAPPPPVDALEPEGWSHDGNGEITEGRPQGKDGGSTFFKHSRSLQAKDVWRMRVEAGGDARVGFASEKYNAEKNW